jgi:dihydrofolate reductase
VDRPRCSVFIATSLDGFIARPDGRLDWLEPMHVPGEDHGYRAFFDAVDTIVVGRGTYDVVTGFAEWPYAGKHVVVLTHRPAPARHEETFVAAEPEALLARLAREGARRVYVDGGDVISRFVARGLVDDLTLNVVPIVLGDGIRLFRSPLPERAFALEETRAFPTGLVQLRYRAVRREE